MTGAEARAYAEDWIAAWNSHDLDRILSHYAPEIELLSPIALQRVGAGRIAGIPALRAYWTGALKAIPDLKFELLGVLLGHECVTLRYKNQRDQEVVETLEFGMDGKVVRAFACYSQ